jgi:hypothetical protein
MCTLLGFCTHVGFLLDHQRAIQDGILRHWQGAFLCTKEHISISVDHGEKSHPRIPFFLGAGFALSDTGESGPGAGTADAPPRLPT